MKLYIFDDRRARAWEPFALTRPVGTLLMGCTRLADRAARLWDLRLAGTVSADALLGFSEPGAPPVLRAGDIPTDEPRIYLSSRAVIDGPSSVPPAGSGTHPLQLGGETVGWIIPAGGPSPEEGGLMDPADWGPDGLGAPIQLEGESLDWPWTLMDRSPDWVDRDLRALGDPATLPLPDGVERLGAGPLQIDPSAHLERGVVLDTRAGGIRLGPGVRVEAGTRLVGPSCVGRDSTLVGGRFDRVTVGPVCRLRGELEASVVLGFSNKAHDGFIGHSILGTWVNLGAFTTNSDLKNTYGLVRVPMANGPMDTGLDKVGAMLGDHVKTGIGTLIPTGALVGAGSNVVTGGLCPAAIPPFSWVTPDGSERFDRDRFLAIARKVMGRRGVELGDSQERLLREAWERV